MRLAKNLKFFIMSWAARSWWFYSTIIRVASPLHRELLLKDNETELVIEGFPRSGNTFAVVAFQSVQKSPIKIAHHTHAQCIVLRAVVMNIPVCVVIRRPEDAVKSLMIMYPDLSQGLLLRQYIRFYEDVFPLIDNIVVAHFDDVTSDYGNIIERINKKFDKKYVRFAHTEENVNLVYQEVARINDLHYQGAFSSLAIPHKTKENIKPNLVFNEYEQLLLARANEIYEVFGKYRNSCL